jgi:hypothetical protein
MSRKELHWPKEFDNDRIHRLFLGFHYFRHEERGWEFRKQTLAMTTMVELVGMTKEGTRFDEAIQDCDSSLHNHNLERPFIEILQSKERWNSR